MHLKKLAFGFSAACFITLLLTASSPASENSTINRCLKYKAIVIKESHYVAGLDSPYDDYLSQIHQESQCEATATSFDGGKGLSQATGDTIEWLQKTFNGKLKSISSVADPYNPRWSIRAMISFDCWLKDRATCKTWYGAFRSYNGGLGLFNKEAGRAKSCEQKDIEAQCRRNIITLPSGGKLDLCRVNIEYPYFIFERAKHYR